MGFDNAWPIGSERIICLSGKVRGNSVSVFLTLPFEQYSSDKVNIALLQYSVNSPDDQCSTIEVLTIFS
jgi:hypothetical protein